MPAGGEVQRGVLLVVPERRRDAHPDPTDRVDHALEPREVDQGELRDRQARDGGDRRQRARRRQTDIARAPPDPERRVELVRARPRHPARRVAIEVARGDERLRVARDRYRIDPAAVCRDVDDDRRVGPHPVDLAPDRCVLTRPRVRAQHHERHGSPRRQVGRGPVGRCTRRRADQAVERSHRGDVPAQVGQGERSRRPTEREHCDDRERDVPQRRRAVAPGIRVARQMGRRAGPSQIRHGHTLGVRRPARASLLWTVCEDAVLSGGADQGTRAVHPGVPNFVSTSSDARASSSSRSAPSIVA